MVGGEGRSVLTKAAAPAIQIERPVIATEDGRSFDGYLARPEIGRGPGLVIFSEMWGVAPSKTEMAGTTRSVAGVPTPPTCFGARNSPVSCRLRKQTKPGDASTPSTGSARRMMLELRCSGCARKRSAVAELRRSASAWADAPRSWQRHAAASMPASRFTHSASPSISTSYGWSQLHCNSITASKTSTSQNQRLTRSSP